MRRARWQRLARLRLRVVEGPLAGVATATLLAKALGSRVIVTAGNDDKCKACLRIGADDAINYRAQDFVAEVKRLTGGRGVDVALDMVAGAYVGREIECLADDGRLAIIAVQGGATASINAAYVMMNRLTITGSTMRPQSVANKGRMAAGLRQKVWPLLEKGVIRPVIFKTFPLANAAAAHAELERADHVGKIMLTV